MRTLPTAVKAHIAAGKPTAVRALVWLVARDRETKAPAPIGLWTGIDAQTVSVDGQSRLYYGLGGLIDLDPIETTSALKISEWSFRVSPIAPEIVAALRQYDPRLAPVEVHEWWWDPATNLPLADPVRRFRGVVASAPLPVPAEGGEAIATVSCMSDAWRLTKRVELLRSQAALEARAPGDGARRYNNVVNAQVYWGHGAMTPSAPTTPPRPATPSTGVLPVTPTGSPPPPGGGMGEWT